MKSTIAATVFFILGIAGSAIYQRSFKQQQTPVIPVQESVSNNTQVQEQMKEDKNETPVEAVITTEKSNYTQEKKPAAQPLQPEVIAYEDAQPPKPQVQVESAPTAVIKTTPSELTFDQLLDRQMKMAAELAE